jgi:four helix bundle suffix protein
MFKVIDPADSDPYGVGTAGPETAANTLVCLISQASYLLDRQLLALQRQFVEHGGFTERLYTVRKSRRDEAETYQADKSNESNPSNKSTSSIPACPLCGKPMVLRTARQGASAGQSFWGCSGYPECKGTRKQG